MHLYDTIREALTSGVLLVSPPFPVFTDAALAKIESVTSRQMPFQAAALVLIYTPLEILLQRQFTFTFDPSGADRPQSRTERTTKHALAEANAWAETKMQRQ